MAVSDRVTAEEYRVLAIDPGPEQSAWVVLRKGGIDAVGVDANGDLRRRFVGAGWCGFSVGEDGRGPATRIDRLAVEMIASYGMAVGAEVFETCVWIGRFLEAWGAEERAALVYRKDVKMHLCGSMKAKDANIRQALIDRFGGKEKAVGNKKNPGPLYGIKGDEWAALAVAVTYADRIEIVK